jgi:hypothetical protein
MLQCTHMLQVYILNVSAVSDVCCKCLFKIFYLFQMYVASVSSRCCICCSGYTHMLQAYILNVSYIFRCMLQQVFHVSSVYSWMRQLEEEGRVDSHVRVRCGAGAGSRHRRSLHARGKRSGRRVIPTYKCARNGAARARRMELARCFPHTGDRGTSVWMSGR